MLLFCKYKRNLCTEWFIKKWLYRLMYGHRPPATGKLTQCRTYREIFTLVGQTGKAVVSQDEFRR